MFGKIGNLIKNAKSGPLPSLGLEDLHAAKTQIKQINEEKQDEAQDLFQEAVTLLQKFVTSPEQHKDDLQDAAYCLVDSLELAWQNPKAFVLLGYVFYMLGDHLQATHYGQMAAEQDIELDGLAELQTLLSDNVKPVPPHSVMFAPLMATSRAESTATASPPNINAVKRLSSS